MIGFFQGSRLPEQVKQGIYFIVDGNGKGSLYKVLQDGPASTNAVLVAETSGAELAALQAAVEKNAEDILANANSIAGALKTLKDITDTHGEKLVALSNRVTAAQEKADNAASAASTNATAIENAGKKIKANEDAITAIKDGTTIDSFKDVEEALAGKEATGVAQNLVSAAKTELQGYADAAAKAVDDKLGFTAGEGADDPKTLKDYVDKKTADMATSSTITNIQDRLDVIEGDYLTSVEEKELSGAIALKADKTALEEEVSRADKEEKRIVGLVEAEASRADKEEKRIVGLVETEASRAAEAEEALDGRLEKVEAFFKTTEEEKLDEALDTLVELQKYLETEGATADQMLLDIAANKEAIEDIGVDYLKAADKTELSEAIDDVAERMTTAEGEIDALQAKFDGSGEGTVAKMIADAVAVETGARETAVQGALNAASTADGKAVQAQKEVDALELVVATKAAQSDLEALQGRVKTVEDEINTVSTGLKARMTAAEGEIDSLQAELETASTGIKARLTAVEGKASSNAEAIAANAGDIADLMAALTWQNA